MSKDLFSVSDIQVLKDFSDTIDSGLTRVAEAISCSPSYPDHPDPIDIGQEILSASDNIERGLNRIGAALERLSDVLEDK